MQTTEALISGSRGRSPWSWNLSSF